jgi:hypothetical protein
MNVNIIRAPNRLDLPTFEIHTGRTYDFGQVVLANAVHAEDVGDGFGEVRIIFQIADASRGMYEHVALYVPWGRIRAAQWDTRSDEGAMWFAAQILREYDLSRYVPAPR